MRMWWERWTTWRVPGQLLLTHAVAYGQPIASADMVLSAQGHLLQATHIRLAAADGVAIGDLQYDDRSGALQGEMAGHGFALSKVAALENSQLRAGGSLDLLAHVEGTPRNLLASGEIDSQNLTLNGQPMGRLHAVANVQHGTLSLTSHAVLFQTHMDLGGQVQLSGEYPAQMQLTFADFNIGPVLRMASSSDINAESSLVGKITLSGPLADAAKIQADAEINTFTATVGGIPMHSAGSAAGIVARWNIAVATSPYSRDEYGFRCGRHGRPDEGSMRCGCIRRERSTLHSPP